MIHLFRDPGGWDLHLGRLEVQWLRGSLWRFARFRGDDWRCWKLGPVWVDWWGK